MNVHVFVFGRRERAAVALNAAGRLWMASTFWVTPM
jgi:hypothetical protein